MEAGKNLEIEWDDRNLKCGFWWMQCGCLQKLASKKLFVLNFGLIGCLCVATSIYFSATISTMEKRFEMATRNSGIISMGFDLSSLLVTPILCHYLKQKHRPHWIAISGMTMAIYCFSVAALHLLYGPGDYALSNTKEYGFSNQLNTTSTEVKTNFLCSLTNFNDCDQSSGNLAPQLYLFVAQFIAGILGTLYDSLGIAYIDDNIVKSKIPLFISFTQFLKLFGAFVGYTLASQSLKYFIAPQLTPVIDITDSKWIGAWWMGWAVLGLFFTVVSFLMQCFPIRLPHAVMRRQQAALINDKFADIEYAGLNKESTLATNYKQFFSNTTLILNVLANVLNSMAYVPLWGFITKYIEIQYKQTASTASLLSGPIPTTCIAIGVLVSGMSFNRIKPKARSMALWNIMVGIFSILSIVSYNYLGCTDIDVSTMESSDVLDHTQSIFGRCHCDYVKYSPICGGDGVTYISPCHAGCSTEAIIINGTEIYENCDCVAGHTKTATIGSCAIKACGKQLFIFVTILCIDRFITASGRVSNFMLTLRLIKPDQKEFSLGMITTLTAILAHIPGPIIFGWIYDQNCLVWGKTCTGIGNCWLYDTKELRFWLSFSSAGLLVLGAVFDCCVWARVHSLVVFDPKKAAIIEPNSSSK